MDDKYKDAEGVAYLCLEAELYCIDLDLKRKR